MEELLKEERRDYYEKKRILEGERDKAKEQLNDANTKI